MSDLFTPNEDAYRGAHTDGSAGPMLGFLDAFDASWTSQRKVHSLLAVEQSMRDIEQEQIKKMRDAGLRPHESLDESDDGNTGPFGTSQFYKGRYSAAAQSVMDGGGWYTDEMVARRDKQIEAVRAERPELGLMTYAEMFGKVREQAQEIERKAQGPTTTLGAVGGFIGGAAGAMMPDTDPINAATLLVGGGAGAAERMVVQGIAQTGVESGNMALTPNNENILLNRQPTIGADLTRLGMAAAGGVLGQGVGEGIAMGARRLSTGKWFADLPPPPKAADAPPVIPPEPMGPVPPAMEKGRPFTDYPDWETYARAEGYDFDVTYGKTRDAKLRSALDLDHVSVELNRWDGPAPFEIQPPRTDVSVPPRPDGVRFDGAYQKYVDNLDTVDDIARRIDPDVFRQYDALTQQRDELRGSIDEAGTKFRAFETSEAFFDAGAAEFKTRDMQARADLQKIDQQMRDLAPLVTRAYGIAEKEWRATPMDWNTMQFLKDLENRTDFRYRGEGKPSLTEQPPKLPAKDALAVPGRTVGDAVPLAKLTPELEARVKLDANADAPTRVAAQVAEDVKVYDEKVEAFVTSAAKVSKLTDVEIRDSLKVLDEKLRKVDPKAENAAEQRADIQVQIDELKYVTLPDGSRLDMVNDKVPYVDAAGNEQQMSVRDFLREMEKDNQALQSVMTCSRPS